MACEDDAEKIKKLKKLQEISIFLNSTLSVDALIERIMKSAKENLGTQDASVMLLDEQSQELYFHYIDPENMTKEQYEALKKIRLKIGEGIAGHTAQTGEPLVINDAQGSPYFSQKGDKATGITTRNMLCVPLKASGKIIGVLEFVNKKEDASTPGVSTPGVSTPGVFLEDDIDDSMALANISAVALENAKLHEAVLRDLQKIKELEESKTTFISTLSHELKTPLTQIRGYADIYTGDFENTDPETGKDYLNIILKESSYLEMLVNDIFVINDITDFGQQLNLKKQNIEELVRTEAEYMAKSTAADIMTETAPGVNSELFLINIDRDKISHCLRHLLDNAVKFSPDGPDISVHIGIIDKDDKKFVEIIVEDHGIGIPREEFSKIFNKFYQVDSSSTRKFEGLGNGLFICKKIAEAHNGEIFCVSTPGESEPGESEPGEGSKFYLLLPAG